MSVTGEFSRFTGSGEVLPEGGAQGTLTIEAASLDTRLGERDTHLRSADFFDAERHPTFTFTADRVSRVADGAVEVTGSLALRGARAPAPLRGARPAPDARPNSPWAARRSA